MKIFNAAAIALAVAVAGAAHATDNDLRSVSGMQQHNRVLIVFTPSLADARLTAQRAVMAQLAMEASRRDLLLVQVDAKTVIGASDRADKLRRKFATPLPLYHAILIDKDGQRLREASGPIEAAAILHAIDARLPAKPALIPAP